MGMTAQRMSGRALRYSADGSCLSGFLVHYLPWKKLTRLVSWHKYNLFERYKDAGFQCQSAKYCKTAKNNPLSCCKKLLFCDKPEHS